MFCGKAIIPARGLLKTPAISVRFRTKMSNHRHLIGGLVKNIIDLEMLSPPLRCWQPECICNHLPGPEQLMNIIILFNRFNWPREGLVDYNYSPCFFWPRPGTTMSVPGGFPSVWRSCSSITPTPYPADWIHTGSNPSTSEHLNLISSISMLFIHCNTFYLPQIVHAHLHTTMKEAI